MDDKILKDDNQGQMKLSNEVILVIAGMAANEVEGVYSLIEDVNAQAYSKKLITKGISVDCKDEEVTLTLNIIVKYGFDIETVAREVQLKINDALENMIGFLSKTINVVVAGVHTEDY